MDERMNTGNLSPEYRLNARRKRLCRRRWIVGCVGYTFFLVLAFPIASLVWVRDNSLTAQLLTIRQDVSDSEQLLKKVENELGDTRTTLNATKLVENQSDWSILLALLAGEVEDDIVLKTCNIEPMNSDPEREQGFSLNSPQRILVGATASPSGSGGEAAFSCGIGSVSDRLAGVRPYPTIRVSLRASFRAHRPL